MTQHDDALPLRHMLDYAQEALELAHARTREDLNTDRMLRYALGYRRKPRSRLTEMVARPEMSVVSPELRPARLTLAHRALLLVQRPPSWYSFRRQALTISLPYLCRSAGNTTIHPRLIVCGRRKKCLGNRP